MTTVSLRTDPEVDRALAELGDTYGNRTSTLKEAILRLAEARRKDRLRQESLEAANDPADRAEAAAVLADMDLLDEG